MWVAYCQALKKLQKDADNDPPFVAMMANGTSGDINNINFRTPRPRQKPYEQMKFVADDVAGKVNAALARLEWKDRADLAARYRELPLQWRTIEPELKSWVATTLSQPPAAKSKADLPTIYAGRVQRLSEAANPALTPVQAFRIGDICVATSPCETFAEMGLEFKKRSPIAHAFMVELNHAYMGYLPTPRHFALGGYETWPGTNYLEPQASVKILDAAVEMAGEMGGGHN
jgi:hypothetical protein